ncbi:MAG: FliM/FliN family flagellar motor C-terminal domain-containing protein [Pseudomonadota bacterium]
MDANQQLSNMLKSGFGELPIEIKISVGISRPLIRTLMEIDENAILPLDKGLEDPVELYVGNKLIALGQLEEIEGDKKDRIGVRIIEVIDIAGAE